MKYMLAVAIIILSFTLCSCNKTQDKDKEKDKEKTNENITFAVNVDLFNSIENIIEKISKKKYKDSYDSLEEIYKLTSKAKIASETDPLATDFIKTLDKLSEAINTESNKQKNNEIYFEYEKSQLSLLANINKQGGGQQGSNNNQGQSSDGGSTDKQGSSSSSGESSDEDKEGITIPEEEALKKYPELLITKRDNEISSSAIDLLAYVSKTTLDSNKENLTAIINREKYLLYKISSLAKLDKYDETNDLIIEAQNNYNALYLKTDEKNQNDIITLSNILKNMKSSLDEKNSTAIELQLKVAIDLMDNLSSKSK